MAVQIQLRNDTAANWTAANPTLAIGEVGVETDTSKFKVGTGSTAWNSLAYTVGDLDSIYGVSINAGSLITLHTLAYDSVDGLWKNSNVINGIQNTLTFKANSAGPTFTGTVVLPTTTSIGDVSSTQLGYINGVTSSIQTQIDTKAPTANATLTGTVVLPATTSIGDVSNTEISYLNNVSSAIQTQIDSKQATITGGATSITTSNLTANVVVVSDASGKVAVSSVTATELGYLGGATSNVQAQINTKAPLDSPTFTGTVVLPATTSVGDVSGTEIGYLNNVSSAIQTQIDSKQATITGGATTITSSDLTANLVLVSDASGKVAVSAVSAVELGYLDGATSNVQAQIDTKAPTANATLTGTVVLPATTSIGDVSNTEISYLNNVSSAIQTQLDAKANLTGSVFTGTVNVTNNTAASSTTTGALVVAGGAGIGEDLYIAGNLSLSGNLILTGNTAVVNVVDLVVTDPLIYIGEGNAGNIVDLGLIANYNTGTSLHAGIARDATDSKWKLFSNVASEPTTTIDFTNAVYDTLLLGTLEGVTVNITNLNVTTNVSLPANTAIGTVSSTEIGYLDGVTSNVQAQINTKQATITGAATTVVSSDLTANVVVVANATGKIATSTVTITELGYLGGATSNVQAQIDTKAPLNAPTFTNLVTVSATGIAFTDGTQTKAGVPSITTISAKTDSYTLSNLNERDTIIEVNSATAKTVTIPTNANVAYPVGTTIDIIQTGVGQITLAGAGGVTVNATPGLKLRTQWSSATLLKRATDTWLVFGDLTA
jgi:hypothetical protein